MARVFTDGAEFQDTLFWDSGSAIGLTGSPVRSGSLAYNHNGTSNKTFTALSEFYFRVALNEQFSTGAANFITWRSGTTTLGSLRLIQSGSLQKLSAYVGSTQQTVGVMTITGATWVLIEVHVKLADSGGVIEAKVDGIMDSGITFTGDTKPGAETTINNISIVYGGNIWMDDLAMNDTTGGVDDTWCGDGHVILLRPNADGDVTQLTGSDGNQVNNYLLVDEIPPNGDTDYVYGSVVDERDLYNLGASGLSGVSIKRVWAEARCRDTVAAGALVALVLKTNSTEYTGPDVALLTSYTQQILGASHRVNPNTGVAWTVSELDALQAGPKTRS